LLRIAVLEIPRPYPGHARKKLCVHRQRVGFASHIDAFTDEVSIAEIRVGKTPLDRLAALLHGRIPIAAREKHKSSPGAMREPQAEYKLRADLLRVQPIAADQELLHGLGCAEAAWHGGIVEHHVRSGYGVYRYRVIRKRDRRASARVDVRQRDRP